MANYYYTVATLPYLSYESGVSVSLEDFLSLCGEDMSPSDFRALKKARIDVTELEEKELPSFLLPWYRFEGSLRDELAKARADRLGWDFETSFRSSTFFMGMEEIVRESLNQNTPLLAEELLNRYRWKKLDEMEVAHYFDLERMMIIYLKLQLLERKSLFQQEEGEKQFEASYAEILEAVRAASLNEDGES